MRILDGPQIAKVLDYAELIERIAAIFRAGAVAPLRHHHVLAGNAGTLLLMPAWDSRFAGVKIVTVVPGNAARGLASVQSTYILLDGASGEPLAVLDGRELTSRRTAAASALASRSLSRPDSARLLMVGAGELAPHLARAHALVRPIREIAVWNRTPARAEALAGTLAAEMAAKGIAARATADL
ncbi:MAG: ornithine cyclodeaminase family protein, partial [Rhodospirillales bacterium]|nr:ornithine cyclodeaminase family protein [Rhodospirillales bacterium]